MKSFVAIQAFNVSGGNNENKIYPFIWCSCCCCQLGLSALVGLTTVTAANAADKVKVGFVYLTTPGDHGWTYAHEVGRQQVEKHFGDKVETTFVENVPEGPDSARVIRELAKQGNDIIFTTSFGYMDHTIKVAKEFPECEI